jgi:hypothetical protein
MPNNNSSNQRSSASNGGRQSGKHQGKQSTISARPTRGKHNSPSISSHSKKKKPISTLPIKKNTTPPLRLPTSPVHSTEKDRKQQDIRTTPIRDQSHNNTISPDKSVISTKPPSQTTNKSGSHIEAATPPSYKDRTSSHRENNLSDLKSEQDWDASIFKSKSGSRKDDPLRLLDSSDSTASSNSSSSTVSSKSSIGYKSSDTAVLLKNLPKPKQMPPQNKTPPSTKNTETDLPTKPDPEEDITMASSQGTNKEAKPGATNDTTMTSSHGTNRDKPTTLQDDDSFKPRTTNSPD